MKITQDEYGNVTLGDGTKLAVRIEGTVTETLSRFHPYGYQYAGNFTFFDSATDADKRRTMAMGEGFIWHNAEMKGDGT